MTGALAVLSLYLLLAEPRLGNLPSRPPWWIQRLRGTPRALRSIDIERSESLSPHYARSWLLLAGTNFAPGVQTCVRVIEGLKMSYFTGECQPELTPTSRRRMPTSKEKLFRRTLR
jgi:hypothetical protein